MLNKYLILKKLISDDLAFYNAVIFKRKSKIDFKDVLYYIMKLTDSSKSSSVTVSSEMNIDKISDAKNDAFIKKRKLIDPIFFELFLNTLIYYFYDNNDNKLLNKYRVLSVDGTHSKLSKNLEDDGYNPTKNKTYVNCLVSGLYDITHNICINLKLDKCNSERKIYEKQYEFLKKDDIVVHDMGYFSYKILYDLNKLNVFPIFRMKKDSNFVKNVIASKSNENIENVQYTDGTNIKVRTIKYIIGKKEYYLSTTLLDKKITIDILQLLYKKRWDIEEYFKCIKYCLSFKDFHSKSENLIKQEIYIHNVSTLLTRIFEEMYMKDKNIILENKKTNFKNNLGKIINKVMIIILYGELTEITETKEIHRIIKILFKYLTNIVKNRSYGRYSITPPTKWYYHFNINGVT